MLDWMTFNRALATELKSAEKAVILAIVENSMRSHAATKVGYEHCYADDRWWMWQTAEGWREQLPWLSDRTIRQYLKDLEKDGWLFARQLKAAAWDRTNFYSANLERMSQITAPKPMWQNLPDRSGEICRLDVAKLASSSSSKALTCAPNLEREAQNPKSHSLSLKNKKQSTWEPGHALESIFTEMVKLDICKARFDLKGYEDFLQGLMVKVGISIEELAQEAYKWQIYWNDSANKPKSPKGSFNTWIGNWAKRRDEDLIKNATRHPVRSANRFNPDLNAPKKEEPAVDWEAINKEHEEWKETVKDDPEWKFVCPF